MVKKINYQVIHKKLYIKTITKNYKQLRLHIFRSNNHIYTQIINDLVRKTISFSSTRTKNIKILKKAYKLSPIKISYVIGQYLGKKVLTLGVKTLSLDKKNYKFHGWVKSIVSGIKSVGINF